MNILDIHTHNFDINSTSAIINCTPRDFIPHKHQYYSIGIHPWDIRKEDTLEFTKLKLACQHPQVLAIGESGLDKTIETELYIQNEVFKQHIELSESLHKPLIIHCVKSTDEILLLKKEFKPQSPWIIHGFRGKIELAKQLIEHDFYLSFGEKYNENTIANIPTEKLLIETDESKMSIHEIYQEVAKKRSISIEMLTNQVQQNILALFFKQ